MLDEMEMKLTAELPPATLAASQLGALKPGDLIPLTGEMVNQVKLLFEGTPKFLGALGRRTITGPSRSTAWLKNKALIYGSIHPQP